MWKSILSAHRSFRQTLHNLTGSTSLPSCGEQPHAHDNSSSPSHSDDYIPSQAHNSRQWWQVGVNPTLRRVNDVKDCKLTYCESAHNIHLLVSSSSQSNNTSASDSGHQSGPEESKQRHNDQENTCHGGDTGSKDGEDKKSKAQQTCFGCRHADRHSILEAFGWGAVVILGMHLCPSHRHESNRRRWYGSGGLGLSDAASRLSILPPLQPRHCTTALAMGGRATAATADSPPHSLPSTSDSTLTQHQDTEDEDTPPRFYIGDHLAPDTEVAASQA